MKIFNTNNKKKWFMLVGSGVMPTGGGFVPITNFPAFTNYISSSSLTPFINNLYTYAIGIAAILAVVEIIWGGFLWMGSGASISNKEAGRSKILMSILGLVLVLSPYLILSVINPNILSLRLGSNNLALNMNKVATTTNATFVCGSASNTFMFLVSSGCSSASTKALQTEDGFSFCKDVNPSSKYYTEAKKKGLVPVCFSDWKNKTSFKMKTLMTTCENIVAAKKMYGSLNFSTFRYLVLKMESPGCSSIVNPAYTCLDFHLTDYVCLYKIS